MKKTLTVELANDNPAGNNYFYAALELPATEYEIRDAYQRARMTGKEDTYLDISVLDCPVLPELFDKRLDAPTMDELNFFSKRLAALDEEEQLALRAVFPKVIGNEDAPISMKDLINGTYGLDHVTLAHGISSDEELGNLAVESYRNQDVNAVPEEFLHLLDREKVGKLQREKEGGVYLGNNYIAAGEYELPEVYDGVHLPETATEKWSAFRIKIAAPPKEDIGETAGSAKWLTLPTSRKEADKKAKQLGMNRIEDCVYLDFESSVPQIGEEQFGDMKVFDKLNRLAQLMPYLSPQDQVMFKAVLEAEAPDSIDGVLSAIYSLTRYEMSVSAEDGASFFREYLSHHLDGSFDREWLDTLLLRNEGQHLLERLGATVTDYGVISACDRSLYELVPYREEDTQSEECGMQMGGM